MPRLQLNDTLMSLALFKGMGHEELSRLATGTRLEFIKLRRGERLVAQGERASRLLMLTNGTLTRLTRSTDGGYDVEETIDAPWMGSPQWLFGLHQREPSTLTAATDINAIAIDKPELARLCNEFMAVRLNLVNILATRAQHLDAQPWRATPTDLRQCIVRFFADRCHDASGTKVFHMLMERLAAEVNDSRRDVSDQLRLLREAHLLDTNRGRIVIHDLKSLMRHVGL